MSVSGYNLGTTMVVDPAVAPSISKSWARAPCLVGDADSLSAYNPNLGAAMSLVLMLMISYPAYRAGLPTARRSMMKKLERFYRLHLRFPIPIFRSSPPLFKEQLSDFDGMVRSPYTEQLGQCVNAANCLSSRFCPRLLRSAEATAALGMGDGKRSANRDGI